MPHHSKSFQYRLQWVGVHFHIQIATRIPEPQYPSYIPTESMVTFGLNQNPTMPTRVKSVRLPES